MDAVFSSSSISTSTSTSTSTTTSTQISKKRGRPSSIGVCYLCKTKDDELNAFLIPCDGVYTKQCNKSAHSFCFLHEDQRFPKENIRWRCSDKHAVCGECGGDKFDDEKLDILLCDSCPGGSSHVICAGLKKLPRHDKKWECKRCKEIYKRIGEDYQAIIPPHQSTPAPRPSLPNMDLQKKRKDFLDFISSQQPTDMKVYMEADILLNKISLSEAIDFYNLHKKPMVREWNTTDIQLYDKCNHNLRAIAIERKVPINVIVEEFCQWETRQKCVDTIEKCEEILGGEEESGLGARKTIHTKEMLGGKEERGLGARKTIHTKGMDIEEDLEYL